jgi:hypothetical protein
MLLLMVSSYWDTICSSPDAVLLLMVRPGFVVICSSPSAVAAAVVGETKACGVICSSPSAVAADDDETLLVCDLFLTSSPGAVAAMLLT